jgi:uncharacterized protein
LRSEALPFDARVIAALHLPDPRERPGLSVSWLEDYVLANAAVFVRAGIPAVKLQDQTRTVGPASIETVARMAALCRLIRREYPHLTLGVILQAHDAEGPFAVADAAGAAFVRLKVFVGAAMSAEGEKSALAVAATTYRQRIGARNVSILADVHDRTVQPLGGVSQPQAARWAEQCGADALVITGSSFEDSMARIAAVRGAGVKRPILVGGGIDAGNIGAALAAAEGAVVSTALMRGDAAPEDLVRWDYDACARLMAASDASRAA